MPDTSKNLFDRWAAFDSCAVAQLVGCKLTILEEDRAVVELVAGPQHANPMGSLHGGILCDIADAAMGMAWASALAEGETFTTVEMKMNFLRPVWKGKLEAEARVMNRGRNLGYIECDVKDDAGRVVARAGSTCMTLRGEQAVGR